MNIGATQDHSAIDRLRSKAVLLFSSRYFRNSIYVIINLAMVSLVGFAASVLAAHVYSVSEVGIASVTSSVVSLATTVGSLGMGTALLRQYGEFRNAALFADTAVTTVLIGTFVAALGFSLIPFFTASLYEHWGWISTPIILVGSLSAGIQATLETVFVARRDALPIVIANLLASISRLVLIVALASSFGAAAIVLALAASQLISACILAIIFRIRYQKIPRLRISMDVLRSTARMSFPSWLATMTGSIPMLIIPVVIVQGSGAVGVAYWGVAYSFANLLFMIPSVLTRTQLAEAAQTGIGRMKMLRRSAIVVFAVTSITNLITLITAPLLLGIFGAAYRDGATSTLRILAISAFFVSVNYLLGVVVILGRRVEVSVLTNLANAVVVLVVTFLHPSPEGAAMGWLLGEVVNIVLFGLTAILILRSKKERWT